MRVSAASESYAGKEPENLWRRGQGEKIRLGWMLRSDCREGIRRWRGAAVGTEGGVWGPFDGDGD